MADVDSGDILRLGCGLSLNGVYDVVGVWNVEITLTDPASWAAIIPRIQTWANNVYDDLKNTLSEDIGTNVISVANETQSTTLGAIEWNPTWAGVAVAEKTAPGVCAFGWARTYRPRVQIRKYFGVFTEADMADGSWNASVQEDVLAAMDYARAAQVIAVGFTFQAVAYNKVTGLFEYGVSSDVSAEPAYQRRRRRGRGS